MVHSVASAPPTDNASAGEVLTAKHAPNAALDSSASQIAKSAIVMRLESSHLLIFRPGVTPQMR